MPAIEELLQKLGGDVQELEMAYRQLEDIAGEAAAPGKNARRREVADELAAALNAMTEPRKDQEGRDVPPKLIYNQQARNRIARLLSLCGRAESVPALSEALKDLDVREMARFALQRNPAPEATDALAAALAEVGPEFRIGVIAALSVKQNPQALAALRDMKLDKEPDAAVRMAAIHALSQYPHAENFSLIDKTIREAECPCEKKNAWKSALRLADTLVRSGKPDTARRIGNRVQQSDADPSQKKAARMILEDRDR